MKPFTIAKVVYDGIPFQFMTHEGDKIIGQELRAGRVFESNNLSYLRSIIQPESHILDAGANIGAISIILAKLEPASTIYCFEPDPINYSLLNINIVLNNVRNIYTFNYALGKKQKFISFYQNNKNYGDHRTSKPLQSDSDLNSFSSLPTRVQAINIVPFLKQCLGEKAPKFFDMIKIDTQGADFEILETCLPLMNHYSKAIIEYCPYLLLRHGTSKEDVKNIIAQFSETGMISKLPSHTTSPITKEKIITDFDVLSPAIRYYDIVLTGTL